MGQDWSWREHGYPEEGFSVEFNGMVDVRRMPVGGAKSPVVRGTRYVQAERTQVYTVAASLNRFGVNLSEGAQRSFAGLECGQRLTEHQVDAPWGPGLELRGSRCVDGTFNVVARYHRSGRWFYQVLALFKDKGGDEASARYFLDSFRVVR
jgi:hypothetical protein